MNPSPCGYYGDPTHRCVCTPGQIVRYINRISGSASRSHRHSVRDTSRAVQRHFTEGTGRAKRRIRERVIKARDIQTARYHDFKGIHCNAQMTERMIHRYAEPDADGIALLRTAMEKFSLRHAPTTASLKWHAPSPTSMALNLCRAATSPEAIGYRNLDRGDWAERGL